MLAHLRSTDEWAEKSLTAKGFTLIELLVVIIILGILAAVAIFAVGNINKNAKKSACQTEEGTVETAISAWEAQNPDAASGPNTADLLESATPPGNLKKSPKYVSVSNGNITVNPAGCSF